MPLVDIYLSGRKYSVSCDAGQEARLRELGEHVGARLRDLVEAGVAGSDAHMLALAALLLADQLLDAREELGRGAGRAAKDHNREAAAVTIDAVARRLEDIAARLERA